MAKNRSGKKADGAGKTRPRKVIAAFRLNGAVGRHALEGVFRHLGGSGDWDLRLAQSAAELAEEASEAQAGRGADGFLVTAPFVTDDVLAALAAADVPVAFLDVPPFRFPGRRANVVFVRNDDGGIGLLAAKYLSSLGNFRSYAFVPTVQRRDWCDRREQAFRVGLGRKGCPCATFPVGDGADAARDRRELTAWLTTLPKPAAVFSAFDERALQVLECCHDARIDVPGQLALLGVDNDELLCENTTPPLTSIASDNELAGRVAAAALDRLMRGKGRSAKTPETVIYRHRGVVERGSAEPVAPAGHLIRRALSFIRRNATRDIRVPDVISYLGVSRRLADKRFREYHGETILQTITRIRLDEVKRRLRATRTSIKSISSGCGFPDANYLKILFRRHVGMSMRAFRGQGDAS